MKGPSLEALSRLKASQLKYCAFLLGAPLTGTKPEIEANIRERLTTLPLARLDAPERIVSVDMGIRNLAYCVLETPPATSPQALRRPLTVSTWRRIDLLDSKSFPDAGLEHAALQEAFSPSRLARTTYSLTATMLEDKPTTILIEQQRFRSNSFAAVQEWTIRVNMLENMLWACLETFRNVRLRGDGEFPAVHEANPARVAAFWTAEAPLRFPDNFWSGAGDVDVVKRVRKKVEKKHKVGVARSWLTGSSDDVVLEFGGQANETADWFRPKRGRKRSAESSVANAKSAPPKLDDLADCLLQAVAWWRWKENVQKLRRLLEDAAN